MKQMKKILSMFLALVMLFASCSFDTFAATDANVISESEPDVSPSNEQEGEAVVTESTAEDFTYTILNGTYCEITGYDGTETEIL